MFHLKFNLRDWVNPTIPLPCPLVYSIPNVGPATWQSQ